MSEQEIHPVQAMEGSIQVPGDKSISHRAVMFGAMAKGTTKVEGFLPGADCLSTIDVFQKLGVSIQVDESTVHIEGKGLDGLIEPKEVLDVGNSGTTIRLLLGILSGRPFHSVVVGDDSIAKRPMSRVTHPLKEMGVKIEGREEGTYTPLSVRGQEMKAIHWVSKVASAQVKSCILLAGLQSEGTTVVEEPYLSRDHTERMLSAFGVNVERKPNGAAIEGGQTLQAREVKVPGDISSAAFLLVAAALVKEADVRLLSVGVNPTRTGVIDVLKEMGANLTIENEREESGEPVADLHMSASSLNAVTIDGSLIPRLIDEIPVIAVLATQAEGKTVIKEAEELKVKETNRIDTVVNELKKFGADIEATEDGMIINGPTPLLGAKAESYGDHRIGMAMSIAALIADGISNIQNAEAIEVSYPNFFEHLHQLSK
ncbi:3-phosphoshikimate 1-carboxyvinyltransferase [Salsuginibacillus kocurii]|uniref:3-phosphoshikimate 1-carboxyvinyltransferase n=1 Tax=Salsuginibacillus kocurii TaxID=427078 RepID=UPI000363B42F|nr:3-phosphoshikimate 1-carboxyvinyltransferase [Salsuginibacillus kocurii]